VATISQEQHRGNHDRNQRWARRERATLFERYDELHTQGVSQRQLPVSGNRLQWRSIVMRLGRMICALALLAGCVASRPDLQHFTPDLQRLTVGKIGCPPGGITISDRQGDAERASWTATCQGNRYVCTAEDTFRDGSCVRTLEEKQPCASGTCLERT
jgi:hypothetical protein